MSLFDFPRIHFKGNLDINVPTINNAYYFPLTIYDATRSEAYLPPRLYFSSYQKVASIKSNLNPEILLDPINGYHYIEIAPINTIEILRKWCETPVCMENSALDIAYKPYYEVAENDLEPTTILGHCPGYWNMYGDMSVKLTDVKVTGVQQVVDGNIKSWNPKSETVPADVQKFLNASFDLDTQANSGITTASMVETISSQSVYANVFCSRANLYNSQDADEVLFSGKPFRFSALIYSAWRVVNWMPPMAGSGRFCSAVPLAEIDDQEQSVLVQFFNKSKNNNRALKGVFVTFTILEVFENRYNQNIYLENKTPSNPAQSTTIGSITPWYDGDMKTGIIGRNLISFGMAPVYTNPIINAPLNLTPAISQLHLNADGTAIFSVDMGNTWPEEINAFDPANPPTHRGDATFKTLDMGKLSFRYSEDIATEFGAIWVTPTLNPLDKVASIGCVFDFMISDAGLIENIKSNLIQVYLETDKNPEVKVLMESEYMMSSDQKGMYADQGDLPKDGYMVYDQNRQPCQLRIFKKGLPVTEPIPIGIAEYLVPESGNDPLDGPYNVNWVKLKDNDEVALSSQNLELLNNAMYYFVYRDQYPQNIIPNFTSAGGAYTVMDTGSFVCLRVHPNKDYSQYINPENWNKTPPTFEVVYQEIFKLYDVVYPVMALIHPFTKEVWDNVSMAGRVLQRTDPNLWNDILYMPKSRELSKAQYNLLKAWAAYTNQKAS